MSVKYTLSDYCLTLPHMCMLTLYIYWWLLSLWLWSVFQPPPPHLSMDEDHHRTGYLGSVPFLHSTGMIMCDSGTSVSAATRFKSSLVHSESDSADSQMNCIYCTVLCKSICLLPEFHYYCWLPTLLIWSLSKFTKKDEGKLVEHNTQLPSDLVIN